MTTKISQRKPRIKITYEAIKEKITVKDQLKILSGIILHLNKIKTKIDPRVNKAFIWGVLNLKGKFFLFNMGNILEFIFSYT